MGTGNMGTIIRHKHIAAIFLISHGHV